MPPSLILCFHIGLMDLNNSHLLYNYTHYKNQHQTYTVNKLLEGTGNLAKFIKKLKFLNSEFNYTILNRTQIDMVENAEFYDNLRIRVFFYSLYKCFSLSINFTSNLNSPKFLDDEFNAIHLRNVYLNRLDVFKVTINPSMSDLIFIYLETNHLFLLNLPMIRLNNSISIDYTSFSTAAIR